MTKTTGPYFEFVAVKDGAKIEFTFLPGNVSRKIFEGTRDALHSAFKNSYGVSVTDYVRETSLEDGTKTIAVYQTKVLTAIRAILEGAPFRDFKVKVTGVNKEGQTESMLVNNPVDANRAKALIPYFNKNNNDLTTRRAK